MKKPADSFCQRAASSISLGDLSIDPLTRHPELEMMMVMCQCAQHEFSAYRFAPDLSTRILRGRRVPTKKRESR